MTSVPRYTSYPTAPHFKAGLESETYADWLRALNKDQTLSLYFHIPFCRQLCWFCGCHTKVVNNYNPVINFLSLLDRETKLLAEKLPSSEVRHIHFGGGSPTILKAEDFSRFMNRLKDNFHIGDNAEIAIEIDPRTVDKDKIIAYQQNGINRVSLGVQDFSPKVQRSINRFQPYQQVHEVTELFRENGINAMNMDLVYGLPHQTLQSLSETINLTLMLNPDRISLFGYAHVPWVKKHQQIIPEESLPVHDQRLAMANSAREQLLSAGYTAIGLDHFAKTDDELTRAKLNGTLKRNFQGYTTDEADALIGLGPTAISALPRSYAQNTDNSQAYAEHILAGRLPIARGIKLTDDDIERKEIIMSLMCNLKANISADKFASELAALAPYLESGEASYKGDTLKVNPDAQNHLRLIASAFDAYLPGSEFRYSNAV